MISFFEFFVSKRYLIPNKNEGFFSLITFFSFLGISLGVATLIIVMSVMNGFREELTSKILGVNGHMKIQSIRNLKINDYEILKSSLLNQIPQIRVEPTIISQGLISANNNSRGVFLKGLDYKTFSERNLFSNLLPSESLELFKNNKGIVIGTRLQEKLGIKKNQEIKIISANGIDTPFGKITNSATFEVIGFYESGMYEYDVSLILFPLTLIQNFLDMENKVDSIEIFLNNFENYQEYFSKIKNMIPIYYKLTDWRSLNPSLFNAIEIERNVMFLILILIIIVAGFNLVSSMIMLVKNKTRDIGILRTLGASKYQLLKIFIMNGFFIGLVGTLLGLLLGISFCHNINDIKNFIEIFTDGELFAKEIYFFSNLPVIINYYEILLICIFSLFISLIATIYPAYKASMIDPINLIRWE